MNGSATTSSLGVAPGLVWKRARFSMVAGIRVACDHRSNNGERRGADRSGKRVSDSLAVE